MNQYQSPQSLLELQTNIENIQKQIDLACQKAGRNPEQIRILPVTKTLSVQQIQQAYQLGLRRFGENKVLEAKRKYEALNQCAIDWILIGHLQSNKVKYVAKFIDEFHALDSLKLAEKLNHRLAIERRQLAVFIQVNTSNEPSKFGINPAQARSLIEQCQQFSNLKINGLMTLAIHSQNPIEVRRCFQTLRQLRDDLQITYPNIQRLSMGMSSDFIIAIEEGATDIRIGQAIFGPRTVPDQYYWPEC
ncbi:MULTISPECIES: YggS family pyridoxal phosphate-dependent enzyme [unclassified Acinetobacter]|uniref:YggS family pyridoxal phosphate-dependent enzyme n=1 Tax=unclassified Acinetobacter TaxID=196816 RepID=UPI002934575A|nr:MULTISPECIES: YggS family pyridoxal phosphate-dependent enzyme [unclassified Acinetobacter]WOE31741.1 YggS family pyridoxal phosphate-dependent enzyme [Acinetobacter sp. SAAs470]WOE37208.1 YggS family pyridoxal phosphate-dependent enzyme [Acinetobacter sp. SAAs474]